MGMEPFPKTGGWGYGGGQAGRKLKGVRGCCLDDLNQRIEAYSSKFVTFRVCHLGVSPERKNDGPSHMGKRPTGSGGEPSSPNCGASAGVKARHLYRYPA